VTSLMLLTVLTLLSVSVMSTSRLQMTMAGNTQMTQNAFQLAQSANDRFIIRALNNADCPNDLNPGFCNIGSTKITKMKGFMETTNSFKELIPRCPPIPGKEASAELFNAFHFEAVSTGKMGSDAGNPVGQAAQRQGWFVCRSSGKG